MPIPKDLVCDCRRCGYAWVKRIEGRPKRCPKCKEHDWDIPAGKLPKGRPPKPKAAKAKKGLRSGALGGK
jgi:hypothetical protein